MLESDQVTLNGEDAVVPMHKVYKDGSVVRIEDTGEWFTRFKVSTSIRTEL